MATARKSEPLRRRSRLVAALLCAATLCVAPACEGPRPEAAPPPTPPVEPPPEPELPGAPELVDGRERLDPGVTPLAYTLELQLDPARDSFAGRVQIDLENHERRAWLWLHAESLSIASATLEQGERTINATTRAGEHGALLLDLEAPLEVGPATLDLRYTGVVAGDRHGLYRSGEVLVTQLGPDYARRLMPCFDEPGLKAPITLTLRTSDGVQAFSSAPLLESAEAPGGARVWRFDPTPPIPTFLFALTVGAFDVLPVEGSPVPMRVLDSKDAPRSHALIAREAPELLAYEMDYLGLDFPFPKVDLLSVEDLRPAAMENVGLITFDPWILAVEDTSSLHNRRTALWIVAHELAHQWFGDLAGMTWWRDIWLHESTATWLANKTLAALYDDLELWRRRLHRMDASMRADFNPAAASLTPEVRGRAAIFDAYSTQVYHKGAALLETLELWLGPDAVQSAVQGFLTRHRFAATSSEAFIAALEDETEAPVREVVSSFLETPGVPHVHIRWSCDDTHTRVTLTQRRLSPTGAPPNDTLWSLPVCVELRDDAWSDTACLLLTERSQSYSLDGCPEAIHPNAGNQGYYRWSVDDAAWEALQVHGVTVSDWRWWLAHHGALLRSDAPQPEHVLRHLPSLLEFTLQADDSGLEGAALELIATMHHALYDEPAWEAYLEGLAYGLDDPVLAGEILAFFQPEPAPEHQLTLRVTAYELQRLATRHEHEPATLLDLLQWARRDPEPLRSIKGAELYAFRGLCSEEGRRALEALAETLGLEDEATVTSALQEIEACAALRSERASLREVLEAGAL